MNAYYLTEIWFNSQDAADGIKAAKRFYSKDGKKCSNPYGQYYKDMQVGTVGMMVPIEKANIGKIVKKCLGCVKLTCEGPYGNYARLTDTVLFKEIAKAMPNGRFTGITNGGSTYASERIYAELEDGKLSCTFGYEENGADADAYFRYLLDKFPYEKFMEAYKVKPDSLREVNYGDCIQELLGCDTPDGLSTADCLQRVSYEDFLDNLGFYGGETDITEGEYNGVRGGLPLKDFEEFKEGFDGEITVHTVYTPGKENGDED